MKFCIENSNDLFGLKYIKVGLKQLSSASKNKKDL